MNKFFRNAIILNVALLAIFILLDFVTWNAIAVNLNSRMLTILTPPSNPIYTPNVTGIYSNYGIVWVGITVRYKIPYLFLNPQDSLGISINLPLIWFIVTIAVNLYLVWYFGIKKLNEFIETPKQKEAKH